MPAARQVSVPVVPQLRWPAPALVSAVAGLAGAAGAVATKKTG